jgi:hypothetical protein
LCVTVDIQQLAFTFSETHTFSVLPFFLPNAFFAIFHASLTFTLIHCRHRLFRGSINIDLFFVFRVKLVPRYNGMARPEDADVESLQIASKNLY